MLKIENSIREICYLAEIFLTIPRTVNAAVEEHQKFLSENIILREGLYVCVSLESD